MNVPGTSRCSLGIATPLLYRPVILRKVAMVIGGLVCIGVSLMAAEGAVARGVMTVIVLAVVGYMWSKEAGTATEAQ